jgi:hypothetical protein
MPSPKLASPITLRLALSGTDTQSWRIISCSRGSQRDGIQTAIINNYALATPTGEYPEPRRPPQLALVRQQRLGSDPGRADAEQRDAGDQRDGAEGHLRWTYRDHFERA